MTTPEPNPSTHSSPPAPGRYLYSRRLPWLFLLVLTVLVVQRIAMRRAWLGPRETVRAQLVALQRGDFASAYTLAADGIKERFGELAQFRAMIEVAFPEFVRSRSIRIGDSQINAEQAVFEVQVTGAQGGVLHARYHLRLEDGNWRVIAVEPVKIPDRSRQRRVTT